MEVAILSPVFWPEVRRGSERFARDLADGLIERGHRPRLITSHARLPSRTVEDGLPILRLTRPPGRLLERRKYEEFITHVPLSYVALRATGADVAHALYPTDALAAARWGERTGRPSVLGWMGLLTREWLMRRRRRLQITLSAARRCSVVTVLSKAAADGFWRELRIETRVIRPGVNLDAFKPGPARTPEPTVFCGAALDQPQKRVDLLIAAFREVRRQRPTARLLLSRPRNAPLAARISGQAPGVELVDVDERSKLADTYGSAWVSALPSRTEAFGLVLVEALACGTPVVGSAVGGIPEVVDRPDTGRLFPEGDERGLTRALLEALELAEDPATAKACRRHAEAFSMDRCVDAYQALYRELRGEH